MTTATLRLRGASLIARTVLLLTGLFLTTATAAIALVVSVDCGGGTGDFSTIQAAVTSLSPADPNTITVSGTCTESVFLRDFDDLRIEAAASGALVQATASSVFDIFGSESVVLSGLAMDATAGDFGVFAFGSNVRILASDISGASDTGIATIGGCVVKLGGPATGDAVTVHDNPIGIFASESELHLLGRVTIENSTENAMILSRSDVFSRGRDVGNTIRNNGAGIVALEGGQVSFNGLNTIDNNGPYGVFVRGQKHVVFSGYPVASLGPPFFGTTLSNHTVWGVVVASSRLDFLGPEDWLVHTVSNNGAAPIAQNAGIWIGNHAEARLRNVAIHDNSGHGVHASLGAYVNLLDTSISNNRRHGVLLSWNATGELGSVSIADGTKIGPNVTITGNGRKAIRCTTDSVLAGDRTGISPISCNNGGARGFTSDSAALGVENANESSAGLPDSVELEDRALARSAVLEVYAERRLAAQ